jgi:two-component system CheB/CheR fusion protein
MNDEQREHSGELDRLNTLLEGILGNLGVGVVVLDLEQHVQLWNASSEDLWGLRAKEVEGRHFLSLDVGLPLEQLREPIQRALGDPPDATELTVAAVNRRGREVSCAVRVLPLRAASGDHYGVVMLMTPVDDALG